jgi:isocitrate dehydrogenase (NAD+)
MAKKVTLIRGDGIGPEIVDATLRVLDALDAGLEWDEQHAGSGAHEKFGSPLPSSTLSSMAETRCALKGPCETPIGAGFRSVNVAIRKHFDMYANVRPARSVPGLASRFDNVDMVIIRENTEGAYAGIEHRIPPNWAAAETIMLFTRHGCERIVEYAFEYAKRTGRKRVTLIHKANILKETGGLFLGVGREISTKYKDIEFNDMIVDATCMRMVTNPEMFDVVVTTNLFGDILSDLAAGLIGGLGLTPGANIGKQASMFEAVHGTAPDIAGKGLANPTALMLASAMMLDHLDMTKKADTMRTAIFNVLGQGEHLTGDLGGKANTTEYTDALLREIENVQKG